MPESRAAPWPTMPPAPEAGADGASVTSSPETDEAPELSEPVARLLSGIALNGKPGREVADSGEKAPVKDAPPAPVAPAAETPSGRFAPETGVENPAGDEIAPAAVEPQAKAETDPVSGSLAASLEAAREAVPETEETNGDNAAASPDAATSPAADEELVALLKRLSATIDNAHQVLDEAAARGPQIQSDKNAPQWPEHHDPELHAPSAPAPCAALEEEVRHAGPAWVNRRPPEPRRATSIALVVTLMIIAPLAAAGWVVHANPGLLAGSMAQLRALDGPGARDQAGQSTTVVKQATASVLPAGKSADAPPAPAGDNNAAADFRAGFEPGAINGRRTPPEAEPAAVEVARLEAGAAAAARANTGRAEADQEVIRGTTGQWIDIPLALLPSVAGEDISVMIQGVPEGVRLSSGNSVGQGTWILSGEEAEVLALSTSTSFEPARFPLDITIVKSDGTAPQMRSIDMVIRPAKPDAAAADGEIRKQDWAPAGVPVSKEEERTLLGRGRALLEHGDVAAARLVLGYAARRGSVPAMEALARSYDSDHLDKLGVRGVEPDKTKADVWYERASRFGKE